MTLTLSKWFFVPTVWPSTDMGRRTKERKTTRKTESPVLLKEQDIYLSKDLVGKGNEVDV